MRRHRFLTMATSSAAAVVVLWVLLFTPNTRVVEASTIFNSLRQTLFDGFKVTMQDIGAEGVRVNGEVLVALEPAEAAEAGRGKAVAPSALEVQSLYVDIHVVGEESAAEMAGLDLSAVVAMHPETQWIFVKMTGLPDKVVEEEPMAWVAVALTSGGLLLDLEGMGDLFESEGCEILGWKPGDRPKIDLNSSGALSDEEELGDLFMDLLYGRAGGEQIDQLVSVLAESARDVSVIEKQPGLHVLTASDFGTDEAGSAEERTMLAEMVLEIGYREGSGVEWTTVKNIGPYGGLVRLSPIDDEMDPTLFNKERLIGPGVKVLDLSALKPMLEQAQSEGN